MARYFNGTSSCITLANSVRLNLPAAGWSVGGWLKVTDNPGTASTYVFQQRSGSANLFGIICWGKSNARYANKFQVGYRMSSTNWVVMSSSGTPAANREWQHVLLMRSGADFNMYINGESAASGSNANAPAWELDVPLYFGSQEGVSNFFNGHLANWAKWDRPLLSGEIAAIVAGANSQRYRLNLAWDMAMREDLRESITDLRVTNNESTLSAHLPVELPPQNGIIQPVIQRALGV